MIHKYVDAQIESRKCLIFKSLRRKLILIHKQLLNKVSKMQRIHALNVLTKLKCYDVHSEHLYSSL